MSEYKSLTMVSMQCMLIADNHGLVKRWINCDALFKPVINDMLNYVCDLQIFKQLNSLNLKSWQQKQKAKK